MNLGGILVEFWKRSFESGMVPEALKEGMVTPIFNGGDKGNCANYLPVVLTSHVAKMFESIWAQ